MSNIAGKLDDRARERLVARIWDAIQRQPPGVRDHYEAAIEGRETIAFLERDDGLAVIVTIAVAGREIPLVDVTYAELRGEGLH